MKSKVVLFGVLIATSVSGCGEIFVAGEPKPFGDGGISAGGEGGSPTRGSGSAFVGEGGASGSGSGGVDAGAGGAPDGGSGGADTGGVPDAGSGGEGGSLPSPQQVFLDAFPGLVCKAMQCAENGNDSATANTVLQCLTVRWNGGSQEDLSSVCYMYGSGTGVATCEDWVRQYFAKLDPSKQFKVPREWNPQIDTAEKLVNDCRH
jgi:hypothetical protein